ncbi:MAG TPA: hypothetical protein VFO77_15335, partial [Actinoplanes sp.]|nr:hypothetical protein [Actinoplanes sp.]
AVLDLFADLAQAGKAVVMVTHERDLTRHAGRQVVLADGMLVSDAAIESAAALDAAAVGGAAAVGTVGGVGGAGAAGGVGR